MTELSEKIHMLEDKGFDQVLVETFIRRGEYLEQPHAEIFTVLWDGAVLVTVESFQGKSVNNAEAHYNLRIESLDPRPGGSGEPIPTPEGVVWAGRCGIRDIDRHTIGDYWAWGVPMEEWTKTPHIWLVRGDEEDQGRLGEFGEIIEDRFEDLPEEVQTAIGGWRQNVAPTDLYEAETEPEITRVVDNETVYCGNGRETPVEEIAVLE